MNRSNIADALLFAVILSACGGPAEPPTPTLIPTPAFTLTPVATPTPKPPVEIQITACGYGSFGIVTMAGTATNDTSADITFLQATVALLKNGQVVRTDEIYITSATGVNAGMLYGLDYKSKAGGLVAGETIAWSVAYPLDKLSQPFECEASVTNVQ